MSTDNHRDARRWHLPFLLAVGVVAAWLGWRQVQERQAALVLEGRECRVVYETPHFWPGFEISSLRRAQTVLINDQGMSFTMPMSRERDPFPVISDDVFAALAQLKGVEQLAVTRSRLPSGWSQSVSRLPALEYLRLYQCQFVMEDLAELGGCRSLTNLSIDMSDAPDDFSWLGDLRLQSLDLVAYSSSSRGYENMPLDGHLGRVLRRIKRLRSLHLVGFQIQEDFLEGIRGTRVEELDLTYSRIPMATRSLAAFAHVRQIMLCDVGTSADGSEAICSISAWPPGVESVDLYGTQIAPETLISLAEVSSLKAVDLSESWLVCKDSFRFQGQPLPPETTPASLLQQLRPDVAVAGP